MSSELTPSSVVRELDKYVVGQREAKRAVAVALRNRWRRRAIEGSLKDEIHPKNILMIGPTGCGKTEIARRLAKLVGAPFVKVEATKYTEVGYVGKDVESMVRDLVENAIGIVKAEETAKVRDKAREAAEERILDLLHDPASAREGLRQQLRERRLEDREVEIEAKERAPGPMMEILAIPGMDNLEMNLRDMLGNLGPKKTRRRRMKVSEARPFLEDEEAQKLVDMDRVVPRALERAQHDGIIFLDEMDKIADAGGGSRGGPDVSREGVQRDLLPIVEGSNVNTKYGMVKTDHILFIGAGAFHKTKPSDLIPELQGRFPIRVELKSLTTDDFIRILTEPEHSLLRQYQALLKTEGVSLEFKDDAVRSLCEIATQVNEKTENIGARRLHTILERVLEEVSFAGPDIAGQTVEVTSGYVADRVGELVKDQDLSRYIL